ncbi:hypothetical protein F4818DRAFT_399233 [Hypoxylon cercidicola]|nr:hypothetical protein F4818DRAFT_399233 [Hypoxylon cercidicola]
MEAIGTASALAHLLGLSIKTSKAAKSLVQSFLNAPEELVQLATKLDQLRSRIEQLHRLAEELPVSDSLVLLPPEHQTILSSGLQSNLEALQAIRSLCYTRSGTSQTVQARLRWATLDKKRTDQILGRVVKAESQLNIVLSILGIRLASLNHMSLQALGASHTLLQAELRESIEAVKVSIHTEIQNAIESTTQSLPKQPETVEIISDEKAQSNRSGDGLGTHLTAQRESQDIVNETNKGQLRPANQDKFDHNRQTKRSRLDIGSFSSPDLEHEVDPGMRLIEHHMRRSHWYYSRKYGALCESPISDKHRVGTMLTVQSKRAHRKFRFVLEIGFNMFCQQVLKFELNLQQAARYWIGMPKFDCSVTLFNVRPRDASIFQACQKRDLSRVRYLLESGQASIYDSDDEFGGLLEHVLHGHDRSPWSIFEPSIHKLQQVVEHLLDQGCDPSIFYGTITPERLPALLFAFDKGYSSTVSAMLSRGADIVSFGPILAGLFRSVNAGFKWKVQLLRAMGYSDWKAELPTGSLISSSVLHGACEACDFDELLFALEIAQIDPNSRGSGWDTPLVRAAYFGRFLKGVVVLVECGAEVHSSNILGNSALVQSLLSGPRLGDWWLSDTTHYLLLQGANPHWETPYFQTIWHHFWKGSYGSRLSFIRLEGCLAHLLLHGSDPFQLFLESDHESKDFPHYFFQWYISKLYLRASEIGRSWSYRVKREYPDFSSWEEWISNFELGEETRTPQVDICWSPEGLIHKTSRENLQHALRREAGEHGILTDADNMEDEGEYVMEDNTDDEMDDEDEYDTFFQNQTQFHRHISSPEGRRLLSRYPVVLALCDALQFAGYRAEIDDDGDIWYEAGDGDRYFDAREEQGEERDDRPTDFCPICQDFERYGLGHILREAEEAKRELREYREKVKAAGNNLWSV